MGNRENNLFSTLYRHVHQQGENFTTDAFVYLLRTWLRSESDSESACKFLSWLCFENTETAAGDNRFKNPKNIRIDTRGTIEGGFRPDIIIKELDSSVCLIEVKTWGNFHGNQLKNYRDCLDDQFKAVPHKRLVSLTVYPYAFKESCGPDSSRYWSEVHDRLESQCFSDPVIKYLAQQFKQFLEIEKMTYNKIEEEYIGGVHSLLSLLQMLQKAVGEFTKNELGPDGQYMQSKSHREYAGYYFGSERSGKDDYWAGVYFDRPQEIHFFLNNPEVFKSDVLEPSENWAKERYGKYSRKLDISSEGGEFFRKKKEDQFRQIKEFVRESFEMSKKYRKDGDNKGEPPHLGDTPVIPQHRK